MSILVEIPDPLAAQVAAVAKSQATSLEHYVLEAVAKTVAEELPPAALRGDADDPLLGLLADDPELADFITESALERRRTLPLRAPRE